MTMPHITKSELEILNVLWAAGRPLSRAEILEQSVNKTWKENSIHILLNGMLKNEIIREAGFTRSGKVWGRLYAPTLTIEEYYAEQFNVGATPDPVRLVKLLLANKAISQEEIRELIDMLNSEENAGANGMPRMERTD